MLRQDFPPFRALEIRVEDESASSKPLSSTIRTSGMPSAIDRRQRHAVRVVRLALRGVVQPFGEQPERLGAAVKSLVVNFVSAIVVSGCGVCVPGDCRLSRVAQAFASRFCVGARRLWPESSGAVVVAPCRLPACASRRRRPGQGRRRSVLADRRACRLGPGRRMPCASPTRRPSATPFRRPISSRPGCSRSPGRIPTPARAAPSAACSRRRKTACSAAVHRLARKLRRRRALSRARPAWAIAAPGSCGSFNAALSMNVRVLCGAVWNFFLGKRI